MGVPSPPGPVTYSAAHTRLGKNIGNAPAPPGIPDWSGVGWCFGWVIYGSRFYM